MCGRFTLRARLNDILAEWGYEHALEYAERYNICPSQQISIVTGDRTAKLVKWGLVPAWADDAKIGNRLTNARAETVAEKPAFRSAFKKGRCLVVADGFYEWKSVDGKKQPYFIRLKSEEPFAFAGLTERWTKGESPLETAVIITTEANALMAPIHDRMPVILPREARELWLDPEFKGKDQLLALLRPYADDEMIATPVSTIVNSPKNESPECIVPLNSL